MNRGRGSVFEGIKTLTTVVLEIRSNAVQYIIQMNTNWQPSARSSLSASGAMLCSRRLSRTRYCRHICHHRHFSSPAFSCLAHANDARYSISVPSLLFSSFRCRSPPHTFLSLVVMYHYRLSLSVRFNSIMLFVL